MGQEITFKIINVMNLIIIWILCTGRILAQNLPSLLSSKNIYTTFSITAYDSTTQEWGIAVATNNIYVGNSTVYIEPGIGAFSVIAETDPIYAMNGFKHLKQGQSIEHAIMYTKNTDPEYYNRQVAGIDHQGNVFAFTGDALKFWKGNANHKLGHHYVVMGNQLAGQVLDKMAEAFEKSKGSLAQRLLISITAGQKAGGQITGKQSAALIIKGNMNEWFNQIDLRVDNSKSPIAELTKLLNYHYGRITLNQAIFAIKAKDTIMGKSLLVKAIGLVEGWDGIYTKIAKAYIILGDENSAVNTILKAMKVNPKWKETLPAYYFLLNHPKMKAHNQSNGYTLKDWYLAINFLTEINRNKDAIELSTKILERYQDSSFLYYLIGKSYYNLNDGFNSKINLQKAIRLDTSNAEAIKLLNEIGN